MSPSNAKLLDRKVSDSHDGNFSVMEGYDHKRLGSDASAISVHGDRSSCTVKRGCSSPDADIDSALHTSPNQWGNHWPLGSYCNPPNTSTPPSPSASPAPPMRYMSFVKAALTGSGEAKPNNKESSPTSLPFRKVRSLGSVMLRTSMIPRNKENKDEQESHVVPDHTSEGAQASWGLQTLLSPSRLSIIGLPNNGGTDDSYFWKNTSCDSSVCCSKVRHAHFDPSDPRKRDRVTLNGRPCSSFSLRHFDRATSTYSPPSSLFDSPASAPASGNESAGTTSFRSSLLARIPSARRLTFSSMAASSPSLSTLLTTLPISRNRSVASIMRGRSTDNLENGSDSGPTTLSSFRVLQGSIMMFAIMAFVNFAVGSYIMAFHSRGRSSSIVADSNGNLPLSFEHDAYDVLSTEVIHPISLLLHGQGRRSRRMSLIKKRGRGHSQHVPKGILGSAAISSVTDWLGPILPFAGGIDLRRLHPTEAYQWFKGYFSIEHGLPTTSPNNLLLNIIQRGGDLNSSTSSISVETKAPGQSYSESTRKHNTHGSPLIAKQSSRMKNDMTSRPLVLAAPEPFMQIDEIAALTLEEMAQAFRADKARQPSSQQFSQCTSSRLADGDCSPTHISEAADKEEAHLTNISSNDRVEKLIETINRAASLSRGEGVHAARSRHSLHAQKTGVGQEDTVDHSNNLLHVFGDIDAAQFCAALRIFAEWRMLRTVPEGYKSYAVGMSLGQKDVVQNVAKIETVMREWIHHKRLELEEQAFLSTEDDTEDDTSAGDIPVDEVTEPFSRTNEKHILRGPSLRQLLEYERDLNIHTDLPRLKENTAAMGLLWSSRQLRYQTSVFQNILDTPTKYPDTKSAVGAAYLEVYDKFHGWAVQKIFNYSFRAAPEASLIYNHMNPLKLKEITNEARRGIPMSENQEVEMKMEDEGGHGVSYQVEVVLAKTDLLSLSGQTDVQKNTDQVTCSGFPVEENLTAVTEDTHHENFDDQSKIPDSESKGNLWIGFGNHILNEWNKLGHELEKFSGHLEDEIGKIGSEWDKIASRVSFEWNKIASDVAGIFGAHPLESKNHNELEGTLTFTDKEPIHSHDGRRRRVLEGDELEEYISREMESYVREQITAYLSLLKPVLYDLSGLFDEMNMNDPTKV